MAHLPRLTRIAELSIFLVIGGCAERAPEPPELTVFSLAAPDGRVEADFTMITSVRELADGRVLISDERNEAIYAADFESGEVRQIGRSGSGAGEYGEVNRLWPLDGDTTIMVDTRNDRWLILRGAELVGTLPNYDSTVTALANVKPVGFDRLGGVVFRAYRTDESGRFVFEEPMFIVRFDRVAGTMDTISMTSPELATEPTPRPVQPYPGMPVRRIGAHIGIVTRDQITVLPDGSLAIARLDPFRVDRCVPGEGCLEGPQLGATVDFTDDAKTKYLSALVAMRPGMDPDDNYLGWPLSVPPFAPPNRAGDEVIFHLTPAGDLLLERLTISDRPIREHDIIDREGRRTGRLELPRQQRVIGFGAKHAYVVTTDELDVPHLTRHPWSTPGGRTSAKAESRGEPPPDA